MMLFSLFLFFLLFFDTENFLIVCKESLLLWYEKLLPTLFPAMIASNLLLYHLQGKYKISKFIVPIGFLAGFPMGSYLVGKLRRENTLNDSESTWLLSFCNNIGPVYFFNIFLQSLSLSNKLKAAMLFYGIPLFYGLLTWRRDIQSDDPTQTEKKPLYFAEILDYAISDSLRSIVKLCGYIMVFRSFLLIPKQFASNPFQIFCGYGLLEVTSAIDFLQNCGFSEEKYLCLGLPVLTLGGLCGLMQTQCMLSESRIKLRTYLWHKAWQTLWVFAGSLLIFSI